MEYSVAVKVTQVGADAVTGKINALEKALDLTRKTADTLRNSLSQLNPNIQFHINTNDISNGTNSVNEMSNAVEELNRKIDQLNTERFNQLNTNVGNIAPAMSGATRSTNGFMGALGKVGGLIAGAFAVGQITSWGKQALTTAQEMERLNNMLKVMVGSAEASEQAIARIKTMEQGIASIDLKSGIESVTAFMRMGKPEEMAEGYTQALGKAVDYYGGTSQQVSLAIAQLEQLSGKTSGFGEDLRSLSNSLPGVKQMLTEAFGVSSVEEINDLGVTGEQVVDTLISKFNELPQVPVGIAGTFAQLQAEVTDIFTNIGNEIAPFIANLGDTFLPVVKFIGEGFAKWIKQLQEMPGFQEIMDNIAKSITILAQAVFDIISSKPVMDLIQALLIGSSDILLDMSNVIGDIVKGIMDMKPLWKVIDTIVRSAMLGVMAICKGLQWILSKLTGGKIKAPDWDSLEKVALGETEEIKKENKQNTTQSSVKINSPVVDIKKNSEALTKEQEKAMKKAQKEREKAYKQMVKAQEKAYKQMQNNTKKYITEDIKQQQEAVKSQIDSLSKEISNRKSFVGKVKSEIDRLRGIKQQDADKEYQKLGLTKGVHASGVNHTVTNGPITANEIFAASSNVLKSQMEANAISNYIDKTLYGNTTDQMVSQKTQLENKQEQLNKAHENIDKITNYVLEMKKTLGGFFDLAKRDMGVIS